MVVKGGFIAWSVMGDANASIPTPQPVFYRPMFGSFARAIASTGLAFVSKAALEAGVPKKLGLAKQAVAWENCRRIGKRDLIPNSAPPKLESVPQTHQVP